QVRESYNVMDYKALIDYAQANVGKPFASDAIEGIVNLSITYTFSEGGKCHISHTFKALKKVSILSCGFLQSIALSAAGKVTKRYMPNVLPKSGIDFKSIQDMTDY